MSVDIATLGLEVRSDGVVVAGNRLRELALQANKTEKNTSHSMRMMSKAADRLNKSFFSLKNAMFGMGVGMIAKDIITVGAKFEQTMTQVKAVSNATDKQFEALRNKAREMGATTEWSATQAADALQFLSMAGFKTEQSIAALPDVLNLATAGSVDLGQAADIASNILTSMRLKVEDLSKVNNVLAKTMTSSNVNMSMMAESFKYAGSIGAAFGYTIEEISGYIGTLGNAGIQGSMAGTQLAMSFQEISKAFDFYNKKGVDTINYTKNLGGALKLLEEQSASAQDIMDIFGQRSGRAIAAMMGIGTEAIEKYIKTLEDAEGTTNRISEEFRNTTLGRWREFKSIIESIEIDIFDAKSGSLNETLKAMSKYLKDNREKILEMVNSSVEAGKMLMPIIKEVGTLFKTAMDGWNSLPPSVQKVGLIAAIFGGSQGRSAVALFALAKGEADNNLDEYKKESFGIEKKIKEAEAKLKKLKTRASANKWGGERTQEILNSQVEAAQIEAQKLYEIRDQLNKKLTTSDQTANVVRMSDAASLALAIQKVSDKELEAKKSNIQKEVNALVEKQKKIAAQEEAFQKELASLKINISSDDEVEKLKELAALEIKLSNATHFEINRRIHEEQEAKEQSIIDQYELEEEEFEALRKKLSSNKGDFDFADEGLSSVANMIIGVENLTGTWKEYGDTLDEIASKNLSLSETTDLQALANEKLIKGQLKGYSNLARASSKYFKEGSAARKALHTLEITLGAIEIAMELKKVAVSIAGSASVIAAKVGETTAAGALAVVNQGAGNPITAFARMAAMAALVGTFVAAAGGSFSSSGGAKPPAASKTGGTALGMGGDDSSESLLKSFDILEEFSGLQYAELKGIYTQVKELNKNLTGVTNSIMRNVGMIPGEESKIAQGGLKIPEIAIKDIGDNMVTNIKDYIIGKAEIGDFTFYPEYERETAQDTQRLIIDLYKNTKDAIVEYASALGMPTQKIQEYTIAMQTIDVSGLNAEEAAKKWADWYSTMFDTALSDMFSENIGKYQKASEGLMETATRLAAGLQLMETAMQKTGASFSAVEDDALSASSALIESAGGLKEFSELINQFYDDFTTDGNKLRDTKNLLQKEFDNLNIEMPDSKEGFQSLVASLDLADEESQKLYLTLMELAPGFAEVMEANDEFQKSLEDLDEWFLSFGPALNSISKQFKDVEDDMERFRKEIENTGNTIPEGWEKGGAVEAAIKEWVVAMEEYSISSSITSDLFKEIADQQTKLDYEHWKQLKQINDLAESTGNKYPELIASSNELYDLRRRQLDEEINTVYELKSFYEDLSNRIKGLRDSVEAQLKTFQTRGQVSSKYEQLTQQYTELDPTSQDYLDQSTMLLEQIWETGNELFSLEDKAMQELLTVQKEQLQAQLNTLENSKQALEKQIGTLRQIETFLFDLTEGSMAPVQSAEGMMTQYNKLLAEAKKTGDISDLETFVKGGFFEFFKAYGNYKDVNEMVASDIMALGDTISGGATLDDLEVQLKTLNDTIESINNEISSIVAPESTVGGMNLEAWTKSLLPLLSGAEEQINTVASGIDVEISGLNESMLSMIQSLDTWGDELSAGGGSQLLIDSQNMLKTSIDKLNETVSYAFINKMPIDQIVTTAYQNLFGRMPDDAGFNFWVEQLESGTVAMSKFEESLIAGAQGYDKENYERRFIGFASGGTFLAGERGPELVSINQGSTANILSNSDTMRMISQAIGQALTGTGVNADVRVYIGEKEIKDVMVKVTRKDNDYQKEIKRAVRIA